MSKNNRIKKLMSDVSIDGIKLPEMSIDLSKPNTEGKMISTYKGNDGSLVFDHESNIVPNAVGSSADKTEAIWELLKAEEKRLDRGLKPSEDLSVIWDDPNSDLATKIAMTFVAGRKHEQICNPLVQMARMFKDQIKDDKE